MADPDDAFQRLAADAAAAGEQPTGVFERLYVAAAAGEVEVPWDNIGPRHERLRAWVAARGLTGAGKRALVVGCGYGQDAEYLGEAGFDTTAFDVSPTAVAGARERYPGSPVHYTTADLLAPPTTWSQAFDLVVEICTVQALPRSLRGAATEAIAGFVAPGGTLIVICVVQEEPFTEAETAPWPLTRGEIDAFATGGVTTVEVERKGPDGYLWVAEYHRS